MLPTLLALWSAPAPRGPAARPASQLLVEQTGQGESQELGAADDQLCDDVVCAGKAFCYEGVCYCAPGYQPPDCLVDICAGHVNGSDDGCHASEGHASRDELAIAVDCLALAPPPCRTLALTRMSRAESSPRRS